MKDASHTSLNVKYCRMHTTHYLRSVYCLPDNTPIVRGVLCVTENYDTHYACYTKGIIHIKKMFKPRQWKLNPIT